MTLESKEEKPMLWMGLYNQCLKALKIRKIEKVYVGWMMAVAFKEAHSNAFFHPQDLQFKANLLAMPLGTDAARKGWVSFIRVKHGPFLNQIPKFRYESSWHRLFLNHWSEEKPEFQLSLINACSWGIGQKSGLYYLEATPLSLQEAAWRGFCADPDIQLQQMAVDLEQCMEAARGDLSLAFSKYNAGVLCQRTTDYGILCLHLSSGFCEEIAKRNLEQNITHNPLS